MLLTIIKWNYMVPIPWSYWPLQWTRRELLVSHFIHVFPPA